MPNLMLRVDRRLIPRMEEHLDAISQMLRDEFSVPSANVMLVPMTCADGTAEVYAEFLYLEGPGREREAITAFAERLGARLGIGHGRLAFRGIPVTKGRLVSLDVPLDAEG